jgi:succinylglutamic semialdehyde dehydrogenase
VSGTQGSDAHELVSTEPATGEILWRGAVGDVGAAVSTARAAARDWARRPLEERIAVARRYAELVTAGAEDFARLIARETGKPLWEARTEVGSVAAKVAISVAAQAERAGTRESPAGLVTQAVRHKPHGVLAVLGPFNFPAHLPNGHIVPALIAGNTVVFKPSEQTPAVAEHMAGLWAAAGLPSGALELVQGGAGQGRALAGLAGAGGGMGGGVDGLLFTGSAAAGTAIHRALAGRPQAILALEMGGNNPLVVWDLDPADIEPAAALIVQSAYLSAGQRCTCARRLVVRDGADGALIEAVASIIDRTIVGAPFDEPQPFMGPVIDNRAADGLTDAFEAMAASGGRVIRPLARPVADRPFLSPGLVDVTEVAARSDEEQFGPLLQLVRVRDWEAAVAEANATRYGLAAGLIGGGQALYQRFWAETRAGVVNWNRPTTGAASNAPFGGIGRSGNHRPSAYYAADYAAWPVASLEAPSVSAGAAGGIAQGLRPAEQ